ncbi:MAG TPA: BatA domain-containing protein [Verrucomicrobium sp.]|nr:BatA domain-containing protein [Verrucomicrobium sp.]
MTFLEPLLLYALPLAALPVVIHLIHLYRRRQVKWAAMMFLLMAQRMNKGLSRLRQVLILAFRVLAVAAVIFVITRPLAGGWLGLTGGAPDTVMILLDRSASMEQQNTTTGVSKRLAGLRNISRAIHDAVGTRSRLVVVDSASAEPEPIDKAERLLEMPQTGATDTAADVPSLLQKALDYITTNKTGRTDVWLLSDLQQGDWDASGGRWETLRSAYAGLQGVRFHLLTYPEVAEDDLAIRVDRVTRRETSEKAELLLDLRISRQTDTPVPTEVPVRVVINGAATTVKATLKENQLVMQALSFPIDKSMKRGWGRVELPGDACLPNNTYHFVFDEPPIMRSVIVSDDELEASSLAAALSAPADPSRKYAVTKLTPQRAAEIPWEDTGLLIWHAHLPKPDDVLARQLQSHVASGRTLLCLPPESPDDARLFGLGWGVWQGGGTAKPQAVEWWRNDADVLANTRDGASLPVGSLEVARRCPITGEGTPLARVVGREPLLVRVEGGQGGGAYFLGTLAGPSSSSLARDGVVMFAMLHRMLNDGARSLGRARQRVASPGALGPEPSNWKAVDTREELIASMNLPLLAGVRTSGELITALNRPPAEDVPLHLSTTALDELFAGLDFRVLKDTLEDGRSLTNEIWRNFLILMALALLGEALLCMPGRPEVAKKTGSGFAPSTPAA